MMTDAERSPLIALAEITMRHLSVNDDDYWVLYGYLDAVVKEQNQEEEGYLEPPDPNS